MRSEREAARTTCGHRASLTSSALLGRIPGWRKDAAKLLPSSETNVKVHGAYKYACLQGGKSLKRTRGYNKYGTFHCVRYIHYPCLLPFDI